MAPPFYTRQLFVENVHVKLSYFEMAQKLGIPWLQALRSMRQDIKNGWVASPQKKHYHLTPKGRRHLPINVFFSMLQGGMRSHYGN